MTQAMKNVLLVDDDPDMRMFAEEVLWTLPVNVVSESNGDDAIARFDSESFDLVITDYLIPGADGAEVAQHVRSKSEVPVLLISAVIAPRRMKQSGLEEVATRVMSKPIRPDLFEEVVLSLLGLPRPSDD